MVATRTTLTQRIAEANEKKAKKPEKTTPLSEPDKIKAYLQEHPNLKPGLFIYQLTGSGKIDVTTFTTSEQVLSVQGVAGGSVDIFSPKITHEDIESLQAGDVVKIVGSDDLTAEGMILRIRCRVTNKKNQVYLFAQRATLADFNDARSGKAKKGKARRIILPVEVS